METWSAGFQSPSPLSLSSIYLSSKNMPSLMKSLTISFSLPTSWRGEAHNEFGARNNKSCRIHHRGTDEYL